MLFATIESSLRAGWTAGPRIVLGYAVLEAATCILVIYGMSAIMSESAIRVISIVGELRSVCSDGLS
ncbi:MAG: hypothetical protein OIN66_05665 [Candidatus Methanoperedens sp.]|nr:hypothetical protein [Candidatus Methanoperedens sp.]